MKKTTKFNELKKIFKILQGPKGCLWDKKQTHRTLLPYLKEESREFIDAVKSGDLRHMQEELGDILLQVMFHSQIASRENTFDIEDVIGGLIKKLKMRHPHVFGKVKVKSAREVIINWNRIKAKEKRLTKRK
jgi:tetrapyrrole methylase family protein/MazG family protein